MMQTHICIPSPRSFSPTTLFQLATSIIPLLLLSLQIHRTEATGLLGVEISVDLDSSISPLILNKVCSQIENYANVHVIYPASPEYLEDTHHYASNAAQLSACVVEPDTPEKVGKILRIIGKARAPFAVQGGGHAVNQGFSSTTGIHISLSRFDEIKLSQDKLTVDIGAGQKWGRVYDKFVGTGRNVVGGRVSTVGVGGLLTYGGGYSYLSNQFGLAVDLIQEYTLVLPSGTVKRVTAQSDNALFNALKGTGNNFGIVTSFKLKTVPAPSQVWGGNVIWTEDAFQAISTAVANFSTFNTDPKAAILPSYLSFVDGIVLQKLVSMTIFYDGPSPPPGTFDAILAIPLGIKDLGFGPRNYPSLVTSSPAALSANLRTYFQSLPVRSYSRRIVQAFADQVEEASGGALLHSGILISATPEPFTPSAFQHSSGKEAYLHDPKHDCLPSNIDISWVLPTEDAYWKDVCNKMYANITAVAEAEGQDIASCPLYANYATAETPLEKIYLDQLPALKRLRAQIDKNNVMTLAGGFKLL